MAPVFGEVAQRNYVISSQGLLLLHGPVTTQLISKSLHLLNVKFPLLYSNEVLQLFTIKKGNKHSEN
jgi:hypothetical protein